MDLGIIQLKINKNAYMTPDDWKQDIDLIVKNTVRFNELNAVITDKAYHMRDFAYNMVGFLTDQFVWECQQVAMSK